MASKASVDMKVSTCFPQCNTVNLVGVGLHMKKEAPADAVTPGASLSEPNLRQLDLNT